MKTRAMFILAGVAIGACGCDSEVKSTRRFRLPQGNADKGKQAFIALKCTACHTVAGVDLPRPTVDPSAVVPLGGDVAQLRTYGDLLTSVIHPSAEIAGTTAPTVRSATVKSPMPVANDVMTVSQMVDLVTFLQPHYRLLPTPVDWYFPM